MKALPFGPGLPKQGLCVLPLPKCMAEKHNSMDKPTFYYTFIMRLFSTVLLALSRADPDIYSRDFSAFNSSYKDNTYIHHI